MVALVARNWARPVEKVLGIQRRVAQILVGNTVNLVGAGLSGDVNLPTRAASEFRRVSACLNLELLNRLGGDRDGVLIDRQVVIVHSIQQEVVRLLARAVHRNRTALRLIL